MKFGLSVLYFLAFIMESNIAAQNISLESWMNDLPSQVKEVPLIYLAIPGNNQIHNLCDGARLCWVINTYTRGINRTLLQAKEKSIHRLTNETLVQASRQELGDQTRVGTVTPIKAIYSSSHDSMTYGITPSSKVGPDAYPILHGLYPLFRGTILRWTITQASDTWHQLRIGIRYFDLRLATMPNEENFYFTHGLYGDEISKALTQVKEFVDTHPGEVVILDFQHFYGFTEQHHERLMQYLIKLYGPRLVPRQVNLEALTLNSLIRLKKQIIVVYRNNSVYDTSELWQPQMLLSPWPEQDSVKGLVRYLENVKRQPSTGFVHQAVLTPSPSFILLRWPYSIREKCAIPVLLEVLPKLSGFRPGPPLPGDARAPVNVVIGDFVDIADALFPRTIIDLNKKLLQNTSYVDV